VATTAAGKKMYKVYRGEKAGSDVEKSIYICPILHPGVCRRVSVRHDDVTRDEMERPSNPRHRILLMRSGFTTGRTMFLVCSAVDQSRREKSFRDPFLITYG